MKMYTTTKVEGKHPKWYNAFTNMHRRCYSTKFQERFPTYKGCSVTGEWHDRQVFAEWYHTQPNGEGWHLDKDFLFEGNKVYSPATCVLLPAQLNTLLGSCTASRGVLPQGVTPNRGRFKATLWIDGKSHHIGTFDTPEEAFEKYKKAKEENVRRIADLWKERIDPRVYDKLFHYRLRLL